MARNIRHVAPGAAVVLVGFAAVVGSFWIARDYDGSWGPRIFPLMSATALILLGGLMLRSANTTAPEAAGEERIPRGPFMLLALVVLYLWLIGKLGYLLSTGLVTPAALWLFGIRNPIGLAIAAVAAPAVFHLVFFGLLGVFPPYGAWFDLLDVIGG